MVRNIGSRKVFVLYFAALFMIIFSLILVLPEATRGHPPTEMTLEYDIDDNILSVTITHNTPTPSSHYVETLIIYRNDISVIEESYEDQPERQTFTYEFDVFAVDSDVLRAYAECNIGGDIENEITVVGPREYMTLTVNPEPESVEMETEVSFTVNIYTEKDATPLDGVTVVPSADLGSMSEVDELALGGYGFTYTSPGLDQEDIEVVNLSCTKNGYHPLYFEFSFDIVYAADQSRIIVVTIDPVVYRIDEGDTREFDVTVKAGGASLDIPELDVDYSKGKLTTKKEGTGRYTLKYTADYVDADTTGYIKVTASKAGFTTDADEIQFQITDLGENSPSNSDQEGFLEKNLVYIVISVVVIAVVIVIVIFIRRRKGKPRKYQDQYPLEVEAVEVVDDPYYRQ